MADESKKEPLKISPTYLDRINQLRMRRNQTAMVLGVATHEFEQAKAQFIGKIDDDVIEERKIGTMALEDAGLDPSKNEYQIGADGGICKLDAGELHPVMNGDSKE